MERIAVSINEASQLLGIGRTKTYELIAEGKLATFRIGRRRLITIDSIRAIAAQAA